MAKYSTMLGSRVSVEYRAGDIYLPASGTLAADSGKSIFLEEHFEKNKSVKTFRWEIPYQCIVRIQQVAPEAQVELPDAGNMDRGAA
jgi:hypothetical protein